MTIQQVANELGVSTKTLRRWDEKKLLIPERQGTTNIRLYHTWLVGYWKKYLELDRALKAHLALLGEVRRELEKYIVTKPLGTGPTKMFDSKAFIEAHKAMETWEKGFDRLWRELADYPPFMHQARGNSEGEDL